MCRKLTVFLDLQQGNHSIFEYCQEFNNLTWHGAHHIDTDEKKLSSSTKGSPHSCRTI
jgi:hypothetical protein